MSFFGFDTTLPKLTKAELAELGHDDFNDRFDGMDIAQGEDMEVYDFDGLQDQLEEANDDANDDTFGGGDVGRDFDFTAGNKRMTETVRREEQMYVPRQPQQQQPVPSQPVEAIWSQQRNGPQSASPGLGNAQIGGVRMGGTPPGIRQPMGPSLAEIEAQMQRDAITRNAMQHGNMQSPTTAPPAPPGLQGSAPMPSKMMSVEEVERMMMGGQSLTPPVQQQQPIPYPQISTPPHNAQREAMRAEKQKKLLEMSKYNNLMTQSDKDFITRVQISQLVTGDPYSDDFYFQVFNAIRGRNRPAQQVPQIQQQTPGQQQRNQRDRRNGRGRVDPVLKMQQQVQRIVNDAKKRPKMTQLSLEGALGKIALNSVRNPRQLLQVQPRATTPDTGSPKPAASSIRSGEDRRRVLRSIENVYSAVLQLEQLRRVQPPAPSPGQAPDEGLERWNADYREIVGKMWNDLRVMEPLTTIPHPFISILSFTKGKRLIPRVLRHTNPEQTLTLLTMLVANLETLDVIKSAIHAPRGVPTKAVQDEIDTFMNSIIPPLLGFIAEAPLRIMTGLLHLMMERNNIVWTARTKIGLTFYTMFLSRAEMVKVDEAANVDPNDVAQWQEVYGRLFATLQGHFSTLFPLPPPAHQHNAPRVDDMYVWQFLAAIAVGAGMEQQHLLVTEVREKVLENVLASKRVTPGDFEASREATEKLTNVNLFLHALGLDSSQIN